MSRNYSNGCIYKLCCKDVNVKDIYVGSTLNLKNRKRKHKSVCNNPNDNGYNYNVYQCIRENGGFENWDMILVEEYDAKDKKDLNKRERYWLETLGATLNGQVRGRTQAEWYQDNRDRRLVEMKEYGKEYYANNKDEISVRSREKYQENKEQIKENRKTKYTCACGSVLSNSSKGSHEKSTKHKKFLGSLALSNWFLE